MNVTEHAYKRAKERLSWKRNTIDKMAQKALDEGKSHSDVKGRLKRYIDKLWFTHKSANNIKIYGEVLYMFCGNSLVTVYRLPNQLIRKL